LPVVISAALRGKPLTADYTLATVTVRLLINHPADRITVSTTSVPFEIR
jgi:hypothetical protein